MNFPNHMASRFPPAWLILGIHLLRSLPSWFPWFVHFTMSPSKMRSNLKMWSSFWHRLLRSCVLRDSTFCLCYQMLAAMRSRVARSNGNNALNQVHCYRFFKTKAHTETIVPDWPLSLHSGRLCLRCGTHCNSLAMLASTGKKRKMCVISVELLGKREKNVCDLGGTVGKEREKCVWSLCQDLGVAPRYIFSSCQIKLIQVCVVSSDLWLCPNFPPHLKPHLELHHCSRYATYRRTNYRTQNRTYIFMILFTLVLDLANIYIYIYRNVCLSPFSTWNPWFWKSRPERVTISQKSVKTLVKTRSSYQNRRRTPWLQNEDRSIPTGPLLEGTASIYLYQLFWCKQVLDPHISKPFRRQNLRWEGSNLRFASSSSWRVERRSWNNWRLTSWVSCNMSQHVATILDDQKFTHTCVYIIYNIYIYNIFIVVARVEFSKFLPLLEIGALCIFFCIQPISVWNSTHGYYIYPNALCND